MMFLADTGSIIFTIPKILLINALDYDEDWLEDNRILLPESKKPRHAGAGVLDVYMIPEMLLNISGHGIKLTYIHTSDTIKELPLLLGRDLMRFFDWSFNFVEGYFEYEFNPKAVILPSGTNKPYAYGVEKTHSFGEVRYA